MIEQPATEAPRAFLERLAAEAGDSALFPAKVLRLFDQGKARAARGALAAAARRERSTMRRRLQQKYLQDYRIWLDPLKGAPTMWTLNGVGTSLYGAYQKQPDGTSIATLWVVLLFLPVWPLAAYLVLPAEKRSWNFLAKAPLPPFARYLRLAVAALALLAATGSAVVGVRSARWAASHTDLIAYNGFDRPITVSVDGTAARVPPRRHRLFESLELRSIVISARLDADDEPFESHELDLASHADELVVYNIGSRAVLATSKIRYGPGKVPDAVWLDGQPLQFLAQKLDYRFVTPPKTKKVAAGQSVVNTVLDAVDTDTPAIDVVAALLAENRRQQAEAVGRAELRLHPSDAHLAFLVARNALADHDARVALFRDCMARAPGEVDLHRFYQELWPPEERTPVLREYRELAAAQPRSAMHQYLVGRLLDGEDALAHYRRALELEPDHEATHRALGYQMVEMGRHFEALGHYDRFAAFGPRQEAEVLDQRLRLRRHLGAPPAEIAALLDAVQAGAPRDFSLAVLRAHHDLDSASRPLEEVVRELTRKAKLWLDLPPSSPDLNSVWANLALTSGDLPRARKELEAMRRAKQPAVAIQLRLALSDGATEEDRRTLLDADADWWQQLADADRLLAVELVAPAEHQALVASLSDARLRDVVDLITRSPGTPPAAVLERSASSLDLAQQPQALLAAARRLAAAPAEQSRRAGRVLAERARSLALPGELPFKELHRPAVEAPAAPAS